MNNESRKALHAPSNDISSGEVMKVELLETAEE
jgi:hypothetical protein